MFGLLKMFRYLELKWEKIDYCETSIEHGGESSQRAC